MQGQEIHFVKVAKVERSAGQPVYNLQTKTHHNFLVNSGIVVHNCDSIRYFAAARTQGSVKEPEPTPQERQLLSEIQAFTGGELYDVYGGAGEFYD